MEELKKILNKTSNFIYKILKNISASIIKDDNSNLIKSIIKLVILLVIYIIAGFIANVLIIIGTNLIYYFGTTARSILSSVWIISVRFTYCLFIIVSIYQLLELAQKDKKFLSISKDSKKDEKVKNKIFFTIDNVVKILGTIILIPIFVIDIALLFIGGIMVGYFHQGVYLYSLFFIVIGLIIFFSTLIFLIKALLSPGKDALKKYLVALIFSTILISGSSVGVLFETSSYQSVDSLTTDFKTSTITHEYKISSKKDIVFSHDDTDKNMKLVIDDDLGNTVQVIIKHYTTNQVSTSLKENNNSIFIEYSEDLNIKIPDLENLYNLGLSCIKEKTIYNYTLLKYATIEVRVSSEYAKNIKFINNSRKEYTPYERIN